jgi:hypothetical protein
MVSRTPFDFAAQIIHSGHQHFDLFRQVRDELRKIIKAG